MEAYRKAIVAGLTGLASVLAAFGLGGDLLSPETIAAVAGVISTVLVWLVPNAPS